MYLRFPIRPKSGVFTQQLNAPRRAKPPSSNGRSLLATGDYALPVLMNPGQIQKMPWTDLQSSTNLSIMLFTSSSVKWVGMEGSITQLNTIVSSSSLSSLERSPETSLCKIENLLVLILLPSPCLYRLPPPTTLIKSQLWSLLQAWYPTLLTPTLEDRCFSPSVQLP